MSATPTKKSTAIEPRVFYPAAALIAAFVLVAALVPTWLKDQLDAASAGVVNGLGWYYVLIVTGFVAFALYVAFSRYGDIRLGKEGESPQYGLLNWFAMLFAAGMGIGLVFWGVAEPLNHYASPPPGSRFDTPDAVAQSAMTTTFLHWGLHAWAIYVVIGLAVAYAVHRRGRSVSLRWMLEPLFGNRVRGWVGDVIDVVAVVGTLFGVATSLGFGVTQLGSGLAFLGFVQENIGLFIGLTVGITLVATLSVISGLDLGIKWLSTGNIVLAGVLLVAVLLLGPALFVLREFVQSLGDYLANFLSLSFRTMPYQGQLGESWLGGWTTYYWGWWMSWSPFVGIFIARISRGRTVREFVLGVLAVPTLVTFLWFSVLGGTALWQQMYGAGDLVGPDGSVSTTTALFQMLQHLPGGPVLTGLFLLLLVVFFVTSADSASFVVAMMGAGGNPNPPVGVRILWAFLAGAIAAVLLWVGSASGGDVTDGLSALQTMSILVAAPFSVIMVLAVVATLKSLHTEHQRRMRQQEKLLMRDVEQAAVEAAQWAGGAE